MVKRWLTLFIIVALAGTVLAGGATVKGLVTDLSSAAVGAGKWAACYNGSASVGPSGITGTLSPNSPAGPNISGRLHTNASSYLSTSVSGDNEFYDPRSNQSVTIIAVNGADPATVIAAKGYYGSSSYSLGAEPDLPTNPTANIKCEFKADVPCAPTAAASGFQLTWDDTEQKYLVAFNIAATAGTEYKTQISSFNLAIVTAGGDWSSAKTYAGNQQVVESNISNPYYIAGGTYQIRAQAVNQFGNGPWGTATTFTIPAGAGGTGGAVFNFNLLGVDASKLVINSIAIPSKTTASGAVGKASELKAVINTVAGEAVVVAVSKWDPATGTSLTAAFDTSGTLIDGTADFDLAPGEGVQVYTTKNVNLTLVGQ